MQKKRKKKKEKNKRKKQNKTKINAVDANAVYSLKNLNSFYISEGKLSGDKGLK